MDIDGKSSFENGTVDPSIVSLWILISLAWLIALYLWPLSNFVEDFLLIMVDIPWGGHHVLLFGDPAQLLPVSNTDIINAKARFNGYSIVQLNELVRIKDPALSSILLKIREGIVYNEIDSVFNNRLTHVIIKSIDLSHHLF